MDKTDLSSVRAMLAWNRVTNWSKYPHEIWERENIETLDDDLSPAANGYEIAGIVETAWLQDKIGTYVVRVHDEIEDDQHSYWFFIARYNLGEDPDEDLAQEHGFAGLDEAKREAESRLVALLAARNSGASIVASCRRRVEVPLQTAAIVQPRTCRPTDDTSKQPEAGAASEAILRPRPRGRLP